MTSNRSASDLLLLLAALLLPRVVILAVAPEALVSSDLRGWIDVIVKLLEGANPYAATAHLRWPPFWMQILFLLGKLSIATSISVVYAIKGFLVAVECLLVVAIYFLMKGHLQIGHARRLILLGICLNPAAILQVVQHANFDLVVGLWTLLFFFAYALYIERKEESYWLLSALFLGLGIWTKTVPLALIPLLLYRFRELSRPVAAIGLFLALAPVTIAMSVIFALEPEAVTEFVIHYRSAPGFFGISGLLYLFGLQGLASLTGTLFQLLFPAALVWAAVHLYRRGSMTVFDGLSVILLILLAIPTLGPGYGPQYLYWYLPLLVVYYHFVSGRARQLLQFSYAVVAATYLFEYAFFRSHGAFILHLVPTEDALRFCNLVAQPHYQTLIRLPLFLAYSGMLASIWLGLKSRLATDGGE